MQPSLADIEHGTAPSQGREDDPVKDNVANDLDTAPELVSERPVGSSKASLQELEDNMVEEQQSQIGLHQMTVDAKDNDDDEEDIQFVMKRTELVKQNMMSGLSIILTLISILAAFR